MTPADEKAIRAGLAHGDFKALSERALRGEKDPEVQGALAALTLGTMRDKLIPIWLSSGPGYAIACAVHERRFVAQHLKKGTSIDLGVRWLALRSHDQTAFALDMPTWAALSSAFRKLKKDERAKAKEEVRAARKNLTIGLACWTDSLAQLSEEAAETAMRAVELDDAEWAPIEEWATALVPILESKEPALAIVQRGSATGLVNRLAPHAKHVVDLVGAPGTLAEILREALKAPFVDTTAAKNFAKALAAIDDPAVEAFFVQHVESRHIAVVAAAYVASRQTRASDRAQARAVEIHEAALEKTKERSRRAKSAARKTSARRKHVTAVVQAVEAAWEDVPLLLREPPWHGHLPSLPPIERAPVEIPETLDLLSGPRREIAEKWIVKNADIAAPALVQLLGTKKKLALEALGVIAREDPDAVRAAGGDEVLRAARLCDCPDRAGAPEWTLPPVLLANGSRLPERAARHLLEMATFAPYAGLEEMKAVCDRTSLDAFAGRLFALSTRDDDEWAFPAAAMLGGGETMRAMLKAIKEWNRAHTTRDRAVAVVRAMGLAGLEAVAQLSDLGRKVRGQPAEAAQEVLRDIARRERLSADELADMATPEVDLAPLDFGPRKFDVTLGDDLSAAITSDTGQRVLTLRAQKSDDPSKAQVAMERWRDLKKTLADIARSAAFRFEQGMILGRDWRMEPFTGTLIPHPILGRIVRRLVWAKGKQLFRVAEDGTFDVEAKGLVRLVHPLELDAKTIANWGEVLAEHEIIQPFPQIGRPTFAPTAEEIAENALSRFRGIQTTQMAIQGRLLSRGWEKISGEGFTSGYLKRFKSVTAQYTLVDPMSFDSTLVNETTLGAITFGVPLARVPPIAFSEAAYDLHVFAD